MLRLYDDYGNVYDIQEHDAKVRADAIEELIKCKRCAEVDNCFEGKRRIGKCDMFSPTEESSNLAE